MSTSGAAAESAARLKHAKYAELESTYEFSDFAVETGGPWSREAKELARELGRRLSQLGQDPRSGSFLAQRLSVAIQRGNAVSVMGTFTPGTTREGRTFNFLVSSFIYLFKLISFRYYFFPYFICFLIILFIPKKKCSSVIHLLSLKSV